jgi:hypothetical protein
MWYNGVDLKYPIRERKGPTGFCALCNKTDVKMYEGYEIFNDDIIPCDICEDCKDKILRHNKGEKVNAEII